MGSQVSSRNIFSTIWMEITESPTADLECNMIVVCKLLLKFFQTAGGSGCLINGVSELIFLRFNFRFAWSDTACSHLLI